MLGRSFNRVISSRGTGIAVGAARRARQFTSDPLPGPDTVKTKGRWTSHEGTGNRGAGWRYGLVKMVEDPSKYADQVVHAGDQLLVVKDKFPKAKTHLLVLPRQRIDSIYDLREENLHIVAAMRDFGQEIADACVFPPSRRMWTFGSRGLADMC